MVNPFPRKGQKSGTWCGKPVPPPYRQAKLNCPSLLPFPLVVSTYPSPCHRASSTEKKAGKISAALGKKANIARGWPPGLDPWLRIRNGLFAFPFVLDLLVLLCLLLCFLCRLRLHVLRGLQLRATVADAEPGRQEEEEAEQALQGQECRRRCRPEDEQLHLPGRHQVRGWASQLFQSCLHGALTTAAVCFFDLRLR